MQVIMIAVEVCVDRLKFSSSISILLVSRVDRTKYKILTDRCLNLIASSSSQLSHSKEYKMIK